MRIYLLRHGKTKGNREHRYVGCTDEELLTEARDALERKRVRELKRGQGIEKVFVSPLKRCIETAAILYPGKVPVVVEEFRECDFGDFEYKNYQELNGNPDYQRFIDTLGRSGFPGGEDRDTFQNRCVQGMERILEEEEGNNTDMAFILHGGTIMAILDRYSYPHRDYYDWQAGNGEGFFAEVARNHGEWQFREITKI